MSQQVDQIRAWEAGELYPDHDTFLFGHGFGTAIVEEVDRLRMELEGARKVLMFADGHSVAESGFALADLYAEDCEWAQGALQAAGCHPRGRFAPP